MTSRVAVGSAALLAALLLSCTRDAPPVTPPAVVAVPASSSTPSAPASSASPPSSTAPSTPATPQAAAAAPASSCADALPPEDMIDGNLASTEISGLAEIISSTKTPIDGKGPPPPTGLVHFRYEVKVLRWFVGSGPERLVLTQGAEAEFNPRPAGNLLFFSACSGASGSAYEPDVGYFFPLDPACRAEAEERGAAVAKRVLASNGGKRPTPRACKE